MRRSLSLALSAACAVAGLALGTGAAQAAPQTASPATTTSGSVTNCTYGHNGALWLSATCSATDTTTWYLSIYCVRGTGKGSWVNGTLVYGSGTSSAECGTGALEIDDSAIVIL